ncbi:hypothetical protein [Thermoactinospora rubra]|uniref:hypothetical protein n=1 Tax=Thermoactinospora rubra TaxID=1088767 RepID=UPI000A1021DA|nr:hypothetical protein [Thermoactinospora rubra]
MHGQASEAEEIEASRQAIADRLGLPADRITDAILDRIANDPATLHHLAACRHDPQMLDLVLTAVPATGRTPAGAAGEHSTAVLLARAGKAVARWAASGFAQAPDEVFRQRRQACLTCEHLGPPPPGLPSWMTRFGDERTHCGLCGCSVVQKARMATETCPDGRWGTYGTSREPHGGPA